MIKIDLGTGKQKPEGYIGVDRVKTDCTDIVHDCEKGLPFDDNYADEIRSFDFIEHISRENVIHLMNEIWRVLKPGGRFVFKIPDAERGQGFLQDPTHKSFWVKNTFKYFENEYYHDLYGIKAKFKIEKLDSIEYEVEYWGKNYCLIGSLVAIKPQLAQPTLTVEKAEISFVPSQPLRIFTTDDLCPSNLKYFNYWDKVKEKYPELRLIVFTIARKDDKDEEDVSKSKEFKEWYEQRKEWIEIQPHGLTHERPQLGWLPYEEQKERILKSIEILKSYLPKEIIYRFPGFRTMPYSEKILRECGVAAVAHETLIKYFDGRIIRNVFNTHCCPFFNNPITEIWEKIIL